MRKKFLSFLTASALLFVFSPINAQNPPSTDIVILYENDVHCNVDGYAKIKALKTAIADSGKQVGVVSAGDFIQGGSLGSFSQGSYIIDLMNMVGYDAVTPGNHEFDYRLPRLRELAGMLNCDLTSSNFGLKTETEPEFAPYIVKDYDNTKIAYIGVTTPYTLSSASPDQFKDSEGNYIYTFHEDDLYQTVQNTIDGLPDDVDYVIGLTHLGEDSPEDPYSVQNLIAHTTGFDAVIDGHSHTVDPGTKMKDADGNMVTCTSTGTKLANIGQMTIGTDGTITTELIDTNTLTDTDAAIASKIEQMKSEYSTLGNREIAETPFDLVINDTEGKRIIRTTETNLGDLCADAYRLVTGSDIGLMNGGGIRAGISAGTITYNDIFTVFPFGNEVAVLELDGQTIADILEFSVRKYPEENGGFMHVSGLTYTMDVTVDSPCVSDDRGNFVSVGTGTKRVSDIQVLNSSTGKYEPLDLTRRYSVASQSFFLLSQGDGYTMVSKGRVLNNNGMMDVELLEKYITENLGGVIPDTYQISADRVRVVTEHAVIPVPEQKPSPQTSVQ
ncbi:MAG: bifunctional metallophosphatase/5'-nucleotidase [Bulleidia sp.]